MLDANKIRDISQMLKYGKTKGYLSAKRYNLPTYSNFFIIENEEEARNFIKFI